MPHPLAVRISVPPNSLILALHDRRDRFAGSMVFFILTNAVRWVPTCCDSLPSSVEPVLPDPSAWYRSQERLARLLLRKERNTAIPRRN